MRRRVLAGAAFILLAAQSGSADHGLGTPAGSGFDLTWLFLAGIVVVVGLAAWAMFAPEAEETPDEPAQGPPRS